MTEPNRVDKLFKDDFEIVAFAELPYPYRMAVAWYMAVDGEAWCDVFENTTFIPQERGEDAERRWHAYWKEQVHSHLQAFDDAYGDVLFGIATIPTELMLESIVGDEVNVGEGIDLDEVRRRYASGGRNSAYPDHGPDDRWPVVLSSDEEQTLQDGWHRFGNYAGNGQADIPVVFYPEARHFEWKGLPVPAAKEPEFSGCAFAP